MGTNGPAHWAFKGMRAQNLHKCPLLGSSPDNTKTQRAMFHNLDITPRDQDRLRSKHEERDSLSVH